MGVIKKQIQDTSPDARRRHGVYISYAYTAIQVIVNFLYVPILLSTIGRDEYGLYQTVGSVMAYIVSINSVLAAGVGRYYSMYKAEGDERMMENTLAIAKRLYWILSAAALLVVVLLIPLFRNSYSDSLSSSQLDECAAMLLIMAVNTVVTFNNTIYIAAINANERFVFLRLVSMATLIAQPFIILLVARVWPTAVVITCVILFMNIVSAVLQEAYARHYLQVRVYFHGWDRNLVKGLLIFSSGIILVTIADQIFWSSSNLVIAFFFGAGPVAVFAVGSQVYKAYLSAGTGISGVFFQRVSELYHRDHDMPAISALFAKVGRISFLACSLILGGFFVLGPDFISIWAGNGYEDAYLVAIAVMIPLTVDLIQNLGLTILQVMDRYYFRGVVYLSLAIANVLISLVVVPKFGIVSAALSSGICMLLGNGFVMNFYYWKVVKLDIPGFWKEELQLVIPFVFATSISAFVYRCVPFGHGSVFLFIAGGIGYLLVYAILMWRFGMNCYEKGQICRLLDRCKGRI